MAGNLVCRSARESADTNERTRDDRNNPSKLEFHSKTSIAMQDM
jgi:hypothetical protein